MIVTADRGVAQARIKDLHAWARLCALLALAVAVASWAVTLLLLGGPAAGRLRRRAASRRRGRWEVNLVSAMGR